MAQGGIGWHNFLQGRVACQFETLQQKHLTDKNSTQTDKRWTIEIIKKLTKVAWDMWDHRNDILHNDGANFHKKMEGAESDVMIRAELNTGENVLLRADKKVILHHNEIGNARKAMAAGCVGSQSSMGGQTE
jgi:hypothetical protein